MPLTKRIQIILGFVILFIILYFSALLWPVSETIHHLPFLPWERNIPFIPETVFIYLLCYAVPLFAFFLMTEKNELLKALRVFLLGLLLEYIVWMMFPVSYPDRPRLHATNSWVESLVSSLYLLDDPPMNCFPSLHVTFSFLSYFSVKLFAPRWQKTFLLLAVAISISTLTLKQHYALDVLSGFVVALGLNEIVLRGRWNSHLPNIFSGKHQKKSQ